MKIRIREIIYILLLSIAPLFDNVYFLPKLKLPGPWFSQLTTSGLANMVIISTYLLFLIPSLILSYRKKPPIRCEWLVILWPVLNILNLRIIDAPGIVSLENAVFISGLLLCLFRRDELFGELDLFRRWGMLWLLAVYFIVLILPFLIPISGHPIYVISDVVARYRGWSGVGGLAFCGITLVLWGTINLNMDGNEKYMGLAVILLGILGITLTVLRIGWLANCVTFGIMCAINLRKDRFKKFLFFVFLFILSFPLFFFSSMRKKAGTPELVNAGLSAVISPVKTEEKARVTVRLPARSMSRKEEYVRMNPTLEYLYRFDGITNGRVFLDYTLLRAMKDDFILGLGTGGAGRYLREIGYSTLEAHNEYLRLLVDHGVLGMFLFALIAACVVWRFRSDSSLLALITLSILMLTDNVLIYPSFGYGPLFLMLFSLGSVPLMPRTNPL